MAAAATLVALAIVTQDGSALRAAPAAQAPVHAQLPAGELVEVRATKLDHLQVWDHRLERGGYLRASQVRRVGGSEADAPGLLAVLRFLRDTPGAEALGIAYVAAYLQAAPAGQITAEPFDALGSMAERLGRRAGAKASGNAAQQLEVVASYGVKYEGVEREGLLRLCYEGDAFRRVLALPSATPEQRARAALALTRHECVDPALPAQARAGHDRWRAGLLDAPASEALDELTRNRLRLRRAGVWSAIAFGQAQRGEVAQAAAQRALDELAAVNKSELGDDERADYAEAALRVGAVRWAALPAAAPSGGRLQVALRPGEPGRTCVRLVDPKQPAKALAERCTYAVVWPASAQPSADGRALALAVQPLEGWRELWLFHRTTQGWTVDVLPPAAAAPGLGYVEWAGWVPGARPALLVAREARAEGRGTRRFEQLSVDSLAVEKSAAAPQALSSFGRFASAQWKRDTVSLR